MIELINKSQDYIHSRETMQTEKVPQVTWAINERQHAQAEKCKISKTES